MRNKILAATLLSASFAFAQYDGNGGGYNSYGGSVWDTPSSKQDNTSNESTQYDNPNDSSSQYGNTPQDTYQTSQTQYTVVKTNNNYASTQKNKSDLYTHTHRGFYFSTSLTFGYTYLRYSEFDNYDGETTDYKFTGFMTPYEEIRLGAAIANRIAIYGAIGVGIGTGDFEYEQKDPSSPNDAEHYKVDATNIRFLFGAGLEFYPFQDKENPAYGLFVGLCGGFMVDGALYDKTRYNYSYYYGSYDETYSTSDAFFNLFMRFEVGKDWWFARRWSFGVAANYTIGSFDANENDSDRYSSSYYRDRNRESFATHIFGITLRLTH